MSSTGQATSSTSQAAPSISNIQLITSALDDYTKITGIDLSKNPFATALKHSNTPEAILQLIQEREKAFKEYRDGNRRLIRCLSPAVNVIQAFSGILGEAVSYKYNVITLLNRLRQVPFPPAKALFVGIDVLLAVCPSNTIFIDFLLMYQYDRPPVGSRRATMLFSSCSSAWATSLNVWRSIRPFRPLR
jgi:hypothetical protein